MLCSLRERANIVILGKHEYLFIIIILTKRYNVIQLHHQRFYLKTCVGSLVV